MLAWKGSLCNGFTNAPTDDEQAAKLSFWSTGSTLPYPQNSHHILFAIFIIDVPISNAEMNSVPILEIMDQYIITVKLHQVAH